MRWEGRGGEKRQPTLLMNLGPAINHSFIWTEVLNDTKKTRGKARFDVRKGEKKGNFDRVLDEALFLSSA